MTGAPAAVSVIACTRNRSANLQMLLEAMTRLIIPPGFAWEMVVVDNGSTDDTAEIVERFRTHLPLQYVAEARPGLSVARNCGLRVAHGEILAFTDDDCIPSAEWLTTLYDEFAYDPGLDGLGGRVELHDPRDHPMTIRTSLERERLTSAHQLPALMVGCNMAFRRTTVEALGDFDTTLGAGTPVGSAEDTDYLYRALLRGLRIEYVPDVVLAHNHGRRAIEEVRGLRHGYARGRGALLCKYLFRADRGMAGCAYADALWNLRESASTLRSGSFPRTVVERCWNMFVGAVRWIGTRRTKMSAARPGASLAPASAQSTSSTEPL